MAHETVPADIAAAIDAYTVVLARVADEPGLAHAVGSARAVLDAAILHRLRAADEMKAALERIEAGT